MLAHAILIVVGIEAEHRIQIVDDRRFVGRSSSKAILIGQDRPHVSGLPIANTCVRSPLLAVDSSAFTPGRTVELPIRS